MTTARRLHYSYDEYLSALAQSGVKLEYCDGEIYAMAGGTPAQQQLKLCRDWVGQATITILVPKRRSASIS